MNYLFRVLFIFILLGSLYHLIRDLLQIFEVQNFITEVGHWPHQWCSSYCDYVTLPVEIIGVFGSVFVLKMNKMGVIGWFTIVIQPLWIIMTWLP